MDGDDSANHNNKCLTEELDADVGLEHAEAESAESSIRRSGRPKKAVKYGQPFIHGDKMAFISRARSRPKQQKRDRRKVQKTSSLRRLAPAIKFPFGTGSSFDTQSFTSNAVTQSFPDGYYTGTGVPMFSANYEFMPQPIPFCYDVPVQPIVSSYYGANSQHSFQWTYSIPPQYEAPTPKPAALDTPHIMEHPPSRLQNTTATPPLSSHSNTKRQLPPPYQETTDESPFTNKPTTAQHPTILHQCLERENQRHIQREDKSAAGTVADFDSMRPIPHWPPNECMVQSPMLQPTGLSYTTQYPSNSPFDSLSTHGASSYNVPRVSLPGMPPPSSSPLSSPHHATSSLPPTSKKMTKRKRQSIRYSRLLAQAEYEALNGYIEDNQFEDSYIGETYWTAWEKSRFFLGVERCGKKNVRDIQQRIGPTKSVYEVMSYLSTLDRLSKEHHQSIDRSGKSGPCAEEDILIAYEMTDEWLKFESEQAGIILENLPEGPVDDSPTGSAPPRTSEGEKVMSTLREEITRWRKRHLTRRERMSKRYLCKFQRVDVLKRIDSIIDYSDATLPDGTLSDSMIFGMATLGSEYQLVRLHEFFDVQKICSLASSNRSTASPHVKISNDVLLELYNRVKEFVAEFFLNLSRYPPALLPTEYKPYAGNKRIEQVLKAQCKKWQIKLRNSDDVDPEVNKDARDTNTNTSRSCQTQNENPEEQQVFDEKEEEQHGPKKKKARVDTKEEKNAKQETVGDIDDNDSGHDGRYDEDDNAIEQNLSAQSEDDSIEPQDVIQDAMKEISAEELFQQKDAQYNQLLWSFMSK
ncbi:uncharacterized protein BYT42DRAFT_586386 [Radiomyces spectabilis]|uniref:uncharacterized protein n=1 Tax=Radiomyces spectabilis TaxID=64574 RepID=UPI0022203CD7|nr:uncharacterized protein BYT42DRAFT_586386 [Radiomyces spectabilis]KAI8367485.1 hypothetical protein BYT42DRAFT_586386 [Radiomyces spectabilis]